MSHEQKRTQGMVDIYMVTKQQQKLLRKIQKMGHITLNISCKLKLVKQAMYPEVTNSK